MLLMSVLKSNNASISSGDSWVFVVCRNIVNIFQSYHESTLPYYVTGWFGNLTVKFNAYVFSVRRMYYSATG